MIARRNFSNGVTGQSDSFKTCLARQSFAGRLKDEEGGDYLIGFHYGEPPLTLMVSFTVTRLLIE